jgi:hypothetical protein
VYEYDPPLPETDAEYELLRVPPGKGEVVGISNVVNDRMSPKLLSALEVLPINW